MHAAFVGTAVRAFAPRTAPAPLPPRLLYYRRSYLGSERHSTHARDVIQSVLHIHYVGGHDTPRRRLPCNRPVLVL